MSKLGVDELDWPVQSPVLNQRERLWDECRENTYTI